MAHSSRSFATVLCTGMLLLPQSGLAEDLGRDPGNTYGTFENGLSYIIRKNDRPPGRVALYLHIKTGALNETDRQNGLAHFLEHMAFNGSKNFAPNELIPFMNNLGMQFGIHSNAHTHFKETVYKLQMPDNSEKSIDTALTVMSDWASGLLLLESEIDQERGIILEEARRAKGARQRMFDQFREQVFAGSRIATHDIIGSEQDISSFPKAEFDDYWNTWYRPENMTLIVAGDIDPQLVVDKARPGLGSFRARAAARQARGAEIAAVTHPRAFVFSDEEQVVGELQLIVINPARPVMRSVQDYRVSEVENIATWLLNRRLAEMVDRGEAGFRFAGASISSFFNEAMMPGLTAVGEPQDWKQVLRQLITEISRAIEHGFTERELELVRTEWISNAERGLEVEGTRDNALWVGSLSTSVGMGYPILSAAQRLDLVKGVVADITVAEIHETFVRNFKTANYNYVLNMPSGSEGFSLPKPQEVLTAASAAWATKPSAPGRKIVHKEILAEMPQPGTISSQSTDDDLGISTAILANGVMLHHRFMDYRKEQVMVRITLGGGQIQETSQNRGVTDVAALAGASSRLTSSQFRDVMTGKDVVVRANAGLDTLSWLISGSPDDLETGFQLAHAMLTDGRIEQSALDNWKERVLQAIDQRSTQSGGQLSVALEELFFANDVRLRMPTAEEIARLTVDMGQDWLRALSSGAPMEVAIVGDLRLDRALELSARYLGSLPPRPTSAAALQPLRVVKRPPGPYERTVRFDSITPQAMVIAGFVGAESRDVAEVRMLSMASLILTERMIRRLREAEGLVYNISAQHRPSVAVKEMGMMAAQSTTDPAHAERLVRSMLEMFQAFAQDGPTSEELDVARKQMANVIETRMREPTFWLGQMAELRYRERKLEDLKALPEVYQTFTAAQLKDVVARYMQPSRTVGIAAIPTIGSSDPQTP